MGMTDDDLRTREDAELRRMKTEIPLPSFLMQREGWALKAGEGAGGPTYWTLERDAVTICVSVQTDDRGDRNWVFHDVHQAGPGSDRGSIIDYMIQFRGARSIGHARGIVRRMVGWPDPRRQDSRTGPSSRLQSHSPTAPIVAVAELGNVLAGIPAKELLPGAPDDTDIEQWSAADAHWRTLLPLTDFTYTQRRGLRDDFVRAHAYLIRQACETDFPELLSKWPGLRFTNPVFGFEVPNSDGGAPIVAGFDRRYLGAGEGAMHTSVKLMTGKKAGLWLSHTTSTPGGFFFIVIAESPITALSFGQLFGHRFPNALLVAFGGRMQRNQPAHIAKLCSLLPDAKVMVASDADQAGAKFVADIQAHVPHAIGKRPALVGRVNDWNDVLCEEMLIAY